MFEVLLKHIITEQAITAFFDNMTRNFATAKIWCNVGDRVTCTFINDGVFVYVSKGVITQLSDTDFQIQYPTINIDMNTGKGSFIVTFMNVEFKNVTYFEVINHVDFKALYL